MKNQNNTTPEAHEPPAESGIPTDQRPLGYWLRTVDGLISHEFQVAFADQDVTRRDWMLLSILSGDIDAPGLSDRLARRGKRLRSLADRGWVDETDGRWQFTDRGRDAHARLAEIVQGIRTKIAGAVSPQDFATMTASLQAIAGELGWVAGERMPHAGRRGFGPRGRGFGPGFGHGFDGGFDHGFGPGFGGGFGPRRHGGHCFAPDGAPGADGFRPRRPDHGHPHHGHGRGRHGERAYERGFEAGFRMASQAGTPASESAA